MQHDMPLRVLIKKASLEGVWLAVCLERYLVAQGSSEEDALRELKAMLAAEVIYGIEHGNMEQPLAGIEQAPTEYWDAFETAEPCDPPSMTVDIKMKPSRTVRLPEVEHLRLAA